FQAEDGIRVFHVTGVQTCALPIFLQGAGAGAEIGCELTLVELRAGLQAPGDNGLPEFLMDMLAQTAQADRLEYALALSRNCNLRSEERRVGKECGTSCARHLEKQ